MESATFDLYRDIAERTDGDVYLGVVGPVRTGKSTFITRLMELLVMPKIPEGARKERIADELPQSGSGRTIMTTQPQFVPSEAVTVSLSDNAPVRVRLVDSVGYMVRGALGSVDKTGSRMVHTPWYDHDIPFEQAAEVGTRKVMTDHATIGVVDDGRHNRRAAAKRLHRGGEPRRQRAESAGQAVRHHPQFRRAEQPRCADAAY